ncbi:MAG: SDR family NAD(P)-dependent oxidoreductase [Dehalococcoidia bacterium]|nr:SDR family NAD(P)-dependent oxidoreductase [Dehalococcoidia bacterium]
MVLELFDLANKVVCVTGGGRGLGRGMAMALADAGAQVMVASRTQKQLDNVVQEINSAGGTADSFSFDATDSEQVDGLVTRCVETFGRLDVMFANAGIGGGTDAEFWEYPDWAFDGELDTNLKSAFYTCRAASNQMIKQGSGGVLVTTASGTALRGNKNFPYPTAKGGVISFTKSLATMLYAHGIRSNCIIPGFVSQGPAKSDQEKAFREQRGTFIPARRLGEWWELGPLAVFLASEASSYVTGGSFVIDGGGLAGGLGPTGFKPVHEW